MAQDKKSNNGSFLKESCLIIVSIAITGVVTYFINTNVVRHQLDNTIITIEKEYKNQKSLIRDQISREYEKTLNLQRDQHQKNLSLLKEQFKLQEQNISRKLREEFENSISIIELTKSQKILERKFQYFDKFYSISMDAYLAVSLYDQFIQFSLLEKSMNTVLKRISPVSNSGFIKINFELEKMFKNRSADFLGNKMAKFRAVAYSSKYLFPEEISHKIIQLFHSTPDFTSLYLRRLDESLANTNYFEKELGFLQEKYGDDFNSNNSQEIQMDMLTLGKKLIKKIYHEKIPEIDEFLKNIEKCHLLIAKGIDLHK